MTFGISASCRATRDLDRDLQKEGISIHSFPVELGDIVLYTPALRRLSEVAVTMPAKSKLSRLEGLPTELLEQIFLDCLNVNLPLASSHLSTALSSSCTKMAVVLKVFQSNAFYNIVC